MTFEQLDIIKPILKALKDEGYETPTPIQERAIPEVLKSRDILGCAQTGTGKTAAFALPILQQIYNDKDNNRGLKGKRSISAVVLAPTRELAIQIAESFTSYSAYTNLKNTVIFGGVNQRHQVKSIEGGVDVIAATPGRLLDLLNQGLVDLSEVKHFVLDEADRMLDMGMINDVKKIIAKLPEKRQNMLFSATMPNEILRLVRSMLVDPVHIEVTPVSSTTEIINQSVYMVDKHNKKNLLAEVLKNDELDQVLVFSRTKHGADKITKDLTNIGIKARAIHGNKSQTARQLSLNEFKTGKIRVLVATDIAARGIDIEELTYVINYDLPEESETYVHRIGRTGRAGHAGYAYTFCDVEERGKLKGIEKLIGMGIDRVEDHPYPAQNDTPMTKEEKKLLKEQNDAARRNAKAKRVAKAGNSQSSKSKESYKPKETREEGGIKNSNRNAKRNRRRVR